MLVDRLDSLELSEVILIQEISQFPKNKNITSASNLSQVIFILNATQNKTPNVFQFDYKSIRNIKLLISAIEFYPIKGIFKCLNV